MKSQHENIRVQKFILSIAIVLFAIKVIAWYVTQSVAILTDSLESIVNILSGFIGLVSLSIAARPRDRSHPYGHGKIEFISAGIEGTLITLAGLFIIYQAGMSFLYPYELEQLNWGIGIIGFSAVVNYGFGTWAYKTGKRNNSIALMASGKHLQTDTYTTLGIIIGLFLLSITGAYWLDGAVAILFAILIIKMGFKILRRAIAGIMDESDQQLLKEMVSYLQENRQTNWVDLHNLRIVKYGSVLHIDCHLTLPWYFTIKQGHDETDILENLIHEKFGSRIELNTHTDYCHDFSCPICDIQDCEVRKSPFAGEVKWSVENVVSKEKHRL
ncbi:MAG: cation diffusion facilitator family transporter [Balneolaceae bacterium]